MSYYSSINCARKFRTFYISLRTKSEAKVPNISRLQKIEQKRNQVKSEKKNPTLVEDEMKKSNKVRKGAMIGLSSLLLGCFIAISSFYTIEIWAQTEEEIIRLEKIAEKEEVS